MQTVKGCLQIHEQDAMQSAVDSGQTDKLNTLLEQNTSETQERICQHSALLLRSLAS